jgi:hypothetical protein
VPVAILRPGWGHILFGNEQSSINPAVELYRNGAHDIRSKRPVLERRQPNKAFVAGITVKAFLLRFLVVVATRFAREAAISAKSVTDTTG